MITLLGWLFSALLILILLPVLVLFVQVLMACLPARSRASAQGSRPRVAVLVPAHNESSLIVATLDSIRPQLLEGDRLLVVADNCSDDTHTGRTMSTSSALNNQPSNVIMLAP